MHLIHATSQEKYAQRKLSVHQYSNACASHKKNGKNALQALAGELGHAREAEYWVQERTPWLESSQRQGMLDDLQQSLREHGSTQQKPSMQASSPAKEESTKSWASPRVSKVVVQPLYIALLGA